MNRYEARLDDQGRRRRSVFFARLRGSIALAENQPDSAITWFRRGDNEADGLPTQDCTACTPFFVGLALDQGGHADSARKYLTDYVEMAGSDRPFLDRYNLAKALSGWASSTKVRTTRRPRPSTMGGSWICGRMPTRSCSRGWPRHALGSSA